MKTLNKFLLINTILLFFYSSFLSNYSSIAIMEMWRIVIRSTRRTILLNRKNWRTMLDVAKYKLRKIYCQRL